MGDLAFNIAGRLLEKLGSIAFQEIFSGRSFKSDLDKLGETTSTIRAVLLDAEEKQRHNRELTLWLRSLKAVLVDADNVLDAVDFEQRRRVFAEQHGSSCCCCSYKVRRFFSRSNPLIFRCTIGRRVKEIRERLDRIAGERVKFHLSERYDQDFIGRREMADSFVRDSEVLGREEDKKMILDLLLKPIDGEKNNVSVIPICGIGGLGKTTLGKLVYNDAGVKNHFDLRMWVCVSDDFDVPRLVKEILDSATGKVNKNLTIDQLQTRLRDELRDKKFLLVLDDVWNEIPDKWFKLRDFLLGGSRGSQILVTTRKLSVAELMGTIPAYNLEGLSPLDCLSLFLKWAFKEEQDVFRYKNLVEIGKEIAEKCKGVPLALRTLGSLLYSKVDERDWEYVRDNAIWKLDQREDHILPALKLSYDELPSYLKPCFSYCSLFPKDYRFKSGELIQLWMAHGLLNSNDENRTLEDTGEFYFKELWSRSFFQDVEKRGVFYSFQMHDLIHDLALSVAEGECSVVNSWAKNIPNSVRHLSIACSSGDEIPFTSLDKLDRLQTLIFPLGAGLVSNSFVRECIPKFKYLRMLNLSNSSFEILPSYIGSLVHLRYLDLSGNCKIKRLPISLCELRNLQTLGLEDCERLEGLPRDIKNLIDLRYLSITTTEQSFSESGIDCLTSLRTLIITSCENLITLPGRFKRLTALDTLVVYNCEKLISVDFDGGPVDKLSLKTVMFVQLPELGALPEWLEGCSTTLRHLRVWHCSSLTALPQVSPKTSTLERIEIMDCPKLSSLPEGMPRLVSLGKLRVSGCPKLWRYTLMTSPIPREEDEHSIGQGYLHPSRDIGYSERLRFLLYRPSYRLFQVRSSAETAMMSMHKMISRSPPQPNIQEMSMLYVREME